MSSTQSQSPVTPLTYEQEVHALLHAAAANTESLLQYFEAQAANEKGEAKKLTQKCIEWKRDDLRRIRALIPKALEQRDATAEATLPEQGATEPGFTERAIALLNDAQLYIQQYGIGSDSRKLASAQYIVSRLAPAAAPLPAQPNKHCTCPKTVWTGSEPNDSMCELTEEEHAAIGALPAQGEPPQALKWLNDFFGLINHQTVGDAVLFVVTENEGAFLVDKTDKRWRLHEVLEAYRVTSPQQGQGWVRVEERLPEMRLRVLVSCDEPIGAVAYVAERAGKKFFSDECPLQGVTHWQPLPAPPAAAEQSKESK